MTDYHPVGCEASLNSRLTSKVPGTPSPTSQIAKQLQLQRILDLGRLSRVRGRTVIQSSFAFINGAEDQRQLRVAHFKEDRFLSSSTSAGAVKVWRRAWRAVVAMCFATNLVTVVLQICEPSSETM
jgi:hypothetical protein